MKFAAGYQTPRNGERFSDVIADYAPDIDEVYFSWPGMASGRPDTGSGDWGAQQRLERELSALGRAGVKADLLFNGNCYGEDAVSEALRTRVLGRLFPADRYDGFAVYRARDPHGIPFDRAAGLRQYARRHAAGDGVSGRYIRQLLSPA